MVLLTLSLFIWLIISPCTRGFHFLMVRFWGRLRGPPAERSARICSFPGQPCTETESAPKLIQIKCCISFLSLLVEQRYSNYPACPEKNSLLVYMIVYCSFEVLHAFLFCKKLFFHFCFSFSCLTSHTTIYTIKWHSCSQHILIAQLVLKKMKYILLLRITGLGFYMHFSTKSPGTLKQEKRPQRVKCVDKNMLMYVPTVLNQCPTVMHSWMCYGCHCNLISCRLRCVHTAWNTLPSVGVFRPNSSCTSKGFFFLPALAPLIGTPFVKCLNWQLVYILGTTMKKTSTTNEGYCIKSGVERC